MWKSAENILMEQILSIFFLMMFTAAKWSYTEMFDPGKLSSFEPRHGDETNE